MLTRLGSWVTFGGRESAGGATAHVALTPQAAGIDTMLLNPLYLLSLNAVRCSKTFATQVLGLLEAMAYHKKRAIEEPAGDAMDEPFDLGVVLAGLRGGMEHQNPQQKPSPWRLKRADVDVARGVIVEYLCHTRLLSARCLKSGDGLLEQLGEELSRLHLESLKIYRCLGTVLFCPDHRANGSDPRSVPHGEPTIRTHKKNVCASLVEILDQPHAVGDRKALAATYNNLAGKWLRSRYAGVTRIGRVARWRDRYLSLDVGLSWGSRFDFKSDRSFENLYQLWCYVELCSFLTRWGRSDIRASGWLRDESAAVTTRNAYQNFFGRRRELSFASSPLKSAPPWMMLHQTCQANKNLALQTTVGPYQEVNAKAAMGSFLSYGVENLIEFYADGEPNHLFKNLTFEDGETGLLRAECLGVGESPRIVWLVKLVPQSSEVGSNEKAMKALLDQFLIPWWSQNS